MIFLIFPFFTLNAQNHSWGENIQIGISKSKIDQLIKEYVEKKYPERIEKYHEELRKIKMDKINKFKNVIFFDGDIMWQDDINTKTQKLTALESKIYCRNLRHATKKDWRLPTYDELLRLVDYFRSEPAVIDEVDYTAPNRYWTITPAAKDISANWYIDFRFGETGVALREIRYHVRCVRDVSEKEDDF